MNTMNHTYAVGALEEMSKHQDPTIRVIHLTRNPIDRRISNERHTGSTGSNNVPAHCAIGDNQCIRKHTMHSKNVTLPTNNELIMLIESDFRNRNDVRNIVVSAGVQYLPVSYEKLFYSHSAAEWVRIFQFLGMGPISNLTMDKVRENFSMTSTSSRKHEDMISNYHAVKESLRGRPYYNLLR